MESYGTQNVCATCGIAIHWQPTVIGRGVYCCTGCAEGGPCSCDYGLLPQQDDPAAIVVSERRPGAPAQDAARRD